MRALVASGVTLLLSVCGGSQVPREATMTGTFRAFPLSDAPVVASLRLVRGKDARLLLMTGLERATRAFLVGSLTNGLRAEALQTVTPTSPDWDAAGSEDGSLSFVFANPESATVWLSYVSTEGRNTMVSRRYSKGYFSAPHFIRGDDRSLAISSVVDIKGDVSPVLFSREADGGYGEFRRLPAPNDGELLDARLVRSGTGFWLFLRFASPGEGPQSTSVLYCSELDAELREVRPSTRCLSPHELLDFDADVSSGRIVVFATTPGGYAVAEGPDFVAKVEPVAGKLTSPSVLIDGTTVHLAAIEAAGSPGARVLVGTLSRDR